MSSVQYPRVRPGTPVRFTRTCGPVDGDPAEIESGTGTYVRTLAPSWGVTLWIIELLEEHRGLVETSLVPEWGDTMEPAS
jgi:hypothetical protein